MKLDPKAWRGGSVGFFRFLDEVKPRVPTDKGGFAPYVPGPRERDDIARALDGGYSKLVWCWPRRHGKTTVNALLVLWRFLSLPNENVAIVANSEKQVVDTCFKTIKQTIEQTPAIAALVKGGAIKIGLDRIEYPGTGSIIQAFSSNPAALWGKKLTIAQVSELHEHKDARVLNALAGSLIDTRGSLMLVDSTVGPKKSPLFMLYEMHKSGDPKVFFSHIEYADLDDACARSPSWIDPAELRSLSKMMLPTEFALYHLNRWQDASNALFPKHVLDLCRDDYPLDVASVTGGAGHVVGAGLDRARPFSKHGDATVTTCVVKVAHDGGDHFYVLASDQVMLSRAGGVKTNLTTYHRKHGMTRAVLENYETADLSAWCGDQPFTHEVVHATPDKQTAAFTSLYGAAAEGRLHIAPCFTKLLAEMEIFEYETRAGGGLRFGHPPGAHDDHVYSLAWAVYALRDVELNPYEIAGIHCHGNGPAVRLCALNGGDWVPPCGEGCRSMLTAHALYRAYRARGHLTPLSFEEFLAVKLKNIGAHTLPRAA